MTEEVGPLITKLLVAHCDWSVDPRKRWMAVGHVGADGDMTASSPTPVGDPGTLIARLRERAQLATVVVGFDFPIGVPKAYADQASITAFHDFP